MNKHMKQYVSVKNCILQHGEVQSDGDVVWQNMRLAYNWSQGGPIMIHTPNLAVTTEWQALKFLKGNLTDWQQLCDSLRDLAE